MLQLLLLGLLIYLVGLLLTALLVADFQLAVGVGEESLWAAFNENLSKPGLYLLWPLLLTVTVGAFIFAQLPRE